MVIQWGKIIMETKELYTKIYSLPNLLLAWKKARKGKTKRDYVIKFEKDLAKNLLKLHYKLKNQTYNPKPLQTFVIRDPKTRRISKSYFEDRVIHHALINIIELIFDKRFIYDSCANRINKGNLFAIKRFETFKKRVTNNLKLEAFCLKADIKHYFKEINHQILINLLKRKIKDKKVLILIDLILKNFYNKQKGMPLGNLTSQFFANIYLNELDYFIKQKLKVEYYIRYVDDFVILNKSKEQLEIYKKQTSKFLKDNLKLELHPTKSRIISLSKGIDFVGFRIFYYHKLLRKRNIRNIIFKINEYKKSNISKIKIKEIYQGWKAYSRWADTYKLRKIISSQISTTTVTSYPLLVFLISISL